MKRFLACVLACVLAGWSAALRADTVAFVLELKAGDNRVSVPVRLTEDDPARVFEPVLGQLESVRAYDAASRAWLHFSPAAVGAANSLQRIAGGSALVVRMKADARLSLLGDGLADPAIATGWSAFGVAQTKTVRAMSGETPNRLRYVLGSDRIYGYDEKGQLALLAADDTLQPGRFYWIDNDPDGDGIASVDARPGTGSSLAGTATARDTAQVAQGAGAPTPGQPSDAQQPAPKDEAWAKEKLVDYPVAGEDVKLGDFTFTAVRYNNAWSEGIAVLKPENWPASLKPMLGLRYDKAGVPFVLDLRDKRVTGAYYSEDESGLGLALGKDGTDLVLDKDHGEARVDFIGIGWQGDLAIELVAKLPANDNASLPKLPLFVQWAPSDLLATLTLNGRKVPDNHLRLGIALGEEGASANLVWNKEGIRRPGWWFNPSPAARGLLEPMLPSGKLLYHSNDPDDWVPVELIGKTPLEFKASGLLGMCTLTGLANHTCGNNQDLLSKSFDTLVVKADGDMISDSKESGLGRLQVSGGWLAMGDQNDVFQFRVRNLGAMPSLKSYYALSHMALSWRPTFALRLSADGADEDQKVLKEAAVEVALEADLALKLLDRNATTGIFSIGNRLKDVVKDLSWAKLRNLLGLDNVTLRAGARLALGQDSPTSWSVTGAATLVNAVDKLQGDGDQYLQTLRSSGLLEIGVEAVTAGARWQALSQRRDSLGKLANPWEGIKAGWRQLHDDPDLQSLRIDGLLSVKLPDDAGPVGGKEVSFGVSTVGRVDKGGSRDTSRFRTVMRAALAPDANVDEPDGWSFEVSDLSILSQSELQAAADLRNSGATARGLHAMRTALQWENWQRVNAAVKLTAPANNMVGGPFEAIATGVRMNGGQDRKPYWRWTFDFPLNLFLGDANWGVTLREARLVRSFPSQGDWLLFAEGEVNLDESNRNIPVFATYDRQRREWQIFATLNLEADKAGQFDAMLQVSKKDGASEVRASLGYSVPPGTVQDWFGVTPNGPMAFQCEGTGKFWQKGKDKELTCRAANIPLGSSVDAGPFTLTAIRDVTVSIKDGKFDSLVARADAVIAGLGNDSGDPFTVELGVRKVADAKVFTFSGKNLRFGLGNDAGTIVGDLAYEFEWGKRNYTLELAGRYLPSVSALAGMKSYGVSLGEDGGVASKFTLTPQAFSGTLALAKPPVISFGGTDNSLSLKTVTFSRRFGAKTQTEK